MIVNVCMNDLISLISRGMSLLYCGHIYNVWDMFGNAMTRQIGTLKWHIPHGGVYLLFI